MAVHTGFVAGKAALALALIIATASLPAAGQITADRPYARLREAYAAADPAKAAAAYAPDATYAELYPGVSPVLRSGQAEITAGLADLFRSLGLEPGRSGADLNFRMVTRGEAGDTGFYRLRTGRGRQSQVWYGSFATRLAGEQFIADVSGPGDRDGFEGAKGTVLFAPEDEELESIYYDRLVGLYGPPQCPLLVTRSVRRLFVLDECSGQWRGLTRESGLNWTSGKSLIDPNPDVRYHFSGAQSLEVSGEGSGPDKSSRKLERLDAWRSEAIRFGDDQRLAGTLYLPAGPARRGIPAVAIIHGSGPQDRNGYASLIALMAQRFARRGIAVLTYDKRGVGSSDGDWASAGFGDLASDAAAAMAALRNYPEVDPRRVGLAGSSQAGWIAAEAIRTKAEPAFVMLLGAAGAALTVAEQNMYNTRVRMTCARLQPADIALALRQQEAFFAARRDRTKAPVLAELTARARQRPALADWLFPGTIEPGPAPEWYDVLDVDFDPLPIWRSYPGRAYFLFGSADDSTPATLAVQRLAGVKSARVTLVPGMHHIGLRARSVCDGDIAALDQLHPKFLATLDAWAADITQQD